MKELSIEEKAKRYDEAIEIARHIHDADRVSGIELTICEDLFPELSEENEDEKIRKALISFLKSPFVNENITDEKVTPWIAWLENHGEQKSNPVLDIEIPFGAKDSELQEASYYIPEGFHAEIESNRVVIKRGEQKPTNIDLDELVIQLEETIGTSPHSRETIKDFFQKAVQKYMNCLRIANGEIGRLVEENYYLKEQGEQKPANKVIEEEKPLLEKFKQAVYDCAWGKVTCKKESETKEEYANRWAEQLLVLVRDWADDYIDSREDVIRRRFFDKGKQSMYKPAWSEEDCNRISSIKYLLHELDNYNFDNWLDSLKDRVQPKQEWSKEDKERYISCLQRLSTGNPAQPETINSKWFKEHVYPQNTWKPSDAQMASITCAVRKMKESACYDSELVSLLNDLKKLREE